MIGISPLRLVTETSPSIPTTRERKHPIERIHKGSSKSYRRFNKKQVREKLEEYIVSNPTPPLSMASVAHQLGYDPSFVLEHLPEQCHLISDRYLAYRSSQKEIRIARCCDKVRKTTLQIHNEGQYPSIKRIKVQVGGLFKEPAMRDAYQEIMAELGYRD